MLIAFFVNALKDEYPRYTTTVLAHEASRRGHDVCYITPDDFVLSPDDALRVHAHFVPAAKTRTRSLDRFFKDMRAAAKNSKLIDIDDVDVLMLRNDPSNDAIERPWAQDIGIQFGRRAIERGVLVLNDPDSLSHAMNKLYFQSFPREVRADTLITRKPEDIKKFARKHGGKVVLKPLQGSGGQGVFLVNAKTAANLNQMIDAISRDGYVIAQSYVKDAEKGDIRFFLMNGRPLSVDGKFAAMRRVSSKDDIRSNIHAGGKAVAVKISERELRVAELIRPKLLADGMFLVGIDIIGDTILEVNVFSPGNLQACTDMAGVNFATAIVESIERKVQIAQEFPGQFTNQALAVM
ncbi:glutathione synthetase [Lysobacter daejeonensis GH1-9]|uniref:Glutathione synthetase n=1 Tax=Lysobacter daejeonensis GH1-9 TaxID=1385517 RepID=A0A0A0F0L8_9GAMM|nr:glutathione synthetase [Lysobacter daejeonensis]KGM55813.1 glutathione synthetase [Lysobacter daejeonensis GH1-9]